MRIGRLVLGMLVLASSVAIASSAKADNGILGSDGGGTYVLYYINTTTTNTSNVPTAIATGLTTSSPTSFDFAKFDTSTYGSLTAIKITLTVDARIDALVNNSNGSSRTITSLSSQGTVGVTSNAPGDTTSVTVAPAQGLIYTDPTVPYSIGANTTIYRPSQIVDNGDGTFSGGQLVTGATNTTNVGSGNFSFYIGTSSQTIGFTEAVPSALAGGGVSGGSTGVFFSADITTSTTPYIKYYFTSNATAPEPGSFVMAGMGLMGMAGGSVIRRRRKVSA